MKKTHEIHGMSDMTTEYPRGTASTCWNHLAFYFFQGFSYNIQYHGMLDKVTYMICWSLPVDNAQVPSPLKSKSGKSLWAGHFHLSSLLPHIRMSPTSIRSEPIRNFLFMHFPGFPLIGLSDLRPAWNMRFQARQSWTRTGKSARFSMHLPWGRPGDSLPEDLSSLAWWILQRNSLTLSRKLVGKTRARLCAFPISK